MIENILIDYLLGKITLDDVCERFNELIYQIVKEEVKSYGAD